MRPSLQRRTGAALLALAFTPCLLAASIEYTVKAAFLYNFALFIEWPEDRNVQESLGICVLGHDPFGPALDALEGKQVRGRPLHVRRLSSLAERKGCDMLYVSASEHGRLRDILSTLASERGMLSVSDIPGFAAEGGVIELLLDGDTVAFAINVAAAQDAGLSVSSKLLHLARRVGSQ